MKARDGQIGGNPTVKTCLIVGAAAAAMVSLCGSAPRRITSGPKEHLLASYFGIDCWSPNYRYVTKESK